MRSRGALVAAAFLGSGCVMESTTTYVRFRDPSEVALVASPPGQPTATLPAGRAVPSVSMASGRFATSPGASSDYSLEARRLEDGGIGVSVDTKVALADGEHQTVLPPSGALTLTEVPLEHVTTPAAMNGPNFRYPGCVSLARGRAGYHVSVDAPCRGQLGIPYVLETHWENVVEIRERREPDRGLALAMMFLPTLSFVLPGVVLVAVSSHDSADPTPTIGKIFLAVGLGLDLLALPTLLASSSDRAVTIPGGR